MISVRTVPETGLFMIITARKMAVIIKSFGLIVSQLGEDPVNRRLRLQKQFTNNMLTMV